LAHPGGRLRAAMAAERPLQVVGVVNAFTARLAERAGFRALYVSGAGVANASYGLPDLGLTSLEDVLVDVSRITAATELPVVVDADTGWDHEGGVEHTVRALHTAGAAAVQIEDQVEAKRCGHRPGKQLVGVEVMADRVARASAARPDPDMVIVARTDAAAVEGLEAAIERAVTYVDHGADVIFAEALASLEEYRAFTSRVGAPVLANLTEFGLTPLLSTRELDDAGVAIALYPLSAFRAMSRAAETVFTVIRRDGTQASVVPTMQTRAELYEILDYERAERERTTGAPVAP